MRAPSTLKPWLLVAVALAVVPAGSASAVPPVTVHIAIEAMTFSTAQASATVGDTVEWVNKDVVDHSATEKNGGWDVSMEAGKSARVVMKKAGTFAYYCRYHPNMVARLVVTAPARKER